jgi:hypothetical protein
VKELSSESIGSYVGSGSSFLAVFCSKDVPGCERMIHDLSTLADEFPDQIIGYADCTGEGENICEDQSINSYPTFRFFSPKSTDGTDYEKFLILDEMRSLLIAEEAKALSLDDLAQLAARFIRVIYFRSNDNAGSLLKEAKALASKYDKTHKEAANLYVSIIETVSVDSSEGMQYIGNSVNNLRVKLADRDFVDEDVLSLKTQLAIFETFSSVLISG